MGRWFWHRGKEIRKEKFDIEGRQQEHEGELEGGLGDKDESFGGGRRC